MLSSNGGTANICGRYIAPGAAPYTHDYAIWYDFVPGVNQGPIAGVGFTDGTKVSECGVNSNGFATVATAGVFPMEASGNKWTNSSTSSAS